MTMALSMAEPLVGWRVWRIEHTKSGPKLSSVNGEVWPPYDRAEAACLLAEHDAPDAGCRCGLYAAKTLEGLHSLGYPSLARHEALAIGEVDLWGRILIAPRGYRAQYAYPRRFFLDYVNWRQAAWLRLHYGVPVRITNIYELEAHGNRQA
jgi:hypothetical protein